MKTLIIDRFEENFAVCEDDDGSFFAIDISEEISRFYSHLDQFSTAMNNETACGKKLDFVTQEMFRETNTIGSKANSPDVLRHVVEMKSTIERVREMVQNVE